MPFNDQFAGEVVQQLDKQQRTDFWLSLGKMAIYPVLAIVFIVILLRLLKRTPVDDIPIGIPLSQLPHNGNGYAHGHGNGNGNGKPFTIQKEAFTGVVTVDTLNQLMKETPDTMTQAIRNWMAREKPEQN